MIVYLIQPGYCHGTNRYKIGMSTDKSLTRVARGYPKNSTIFCIAGTFDDPRVVENDLIQRFCDRFKTSECGREYFEGSLREMIGVFNATVDKHRKYNDHEESDIISNIHENFVKVDNKQWQCKQCSKTISYRSKKSHFEKTCRKGLSIFQCEFCHLMCQSRDSKWRHKKTCGMKNTQVVEPTVGKDDDPVDKHRKYNNEEYVRVDDKNIQCTRCKSIIVNASRHRHSKTCKGVPKNTCPFCLRCFKTQSVHSRHKKTCKKRPVQQEEKVENITLDFGKEDLSKLEPRLFESFADAIQFVYFNKDYPENQTVRKRVKRDHSMEVMENNQWKPILCSQGIPLIRERLKECGYECSEQMSDPDVRELLYNHTKHGESKI